MGACVSCNNRSRSEMSSTALEKKSKLLSECQDSRPSFTSLLPKESVGTNCPDVRKASYYHLQNQQDYQNSQIQENTPALPTNFKKMLHTSVVQKDIEKPILSEKCQFSHNTPTSPDTQSPESTLALKPSISLPPLRLEMSGSYEALGHGRSKPPQRMQSEPSIGRPNLISSYSAPPRRNSMVSYSAPPSRRQSVSEIQLEMALSPIRFTSHAKVTPPVKRKKTMGKLFSSLSRKKEVKQMAVQDS